MVRKGQLPFEERIGEEKFKELLKRLDIEAIAQLYCDHHFEEEKKAKCKACRRTIYRAKKRVEEKARAGRRFDPIDNFKDIPEIQLFLEYHKGKKWHTVRAWLYLLRRYWVWIREEPKLKATQRPILWDEPHLVFILSKLKETGIALYNPKQALRRFFESQGKAYVHLQKHRLIKAARADMRSQNGQKKRKDRFQPDELKEILQPLSKLETLAIKLHITAKSREGDKGKGSFLDLNWKDIEWKDDFYGFPMATMSIYEPKTKGGTWWHHIPIDLWFGDLSKTLREAWEAQGSPEEGHVIPYNYNEYRKLWLRISKRMGRSLQPHDCRRSPAGWLRDLGLSELALGQYDPLRGEAVGYTGVGWENAEIYYQRYGKRNPLTIYSKKSVLDIAMFDGLIHKILGNK